MLAGKTQQRPLQPASNSRIGMPYVDPFEVYSDGDEISVSGEFVEEDVLNDVGSIETELNNDGPGLTMLQRLVHSIFSNTRTILSFFDSLPQPGTLT